MALIFKWRNQRGIRTASPSAVPPVTTSGGKGARAAFAAHFSTGTDSEWKAIGASVPGGAKVSSSKRCEDYCHFVELYPGVGLFAVADGAGSCMLSGIGAEFVARFAVAPIIMETVRSALSPPGTAPDKFLKTIGREEWTSIAQTAVEFLRQSLERLAVKRRVNVEDLSSTLIVCLVLDDRVLVVHVGDGRGAFRYTDGTWLPLFEPLIGENAGETIFVPSSTDAQVFAQFVRCHIHIGDIAEICLMSDGCEAPSFQTTIFDHKAGRHRRANIPFPGFLNAIEPFVSSLDWKSSQGLVDWITFVKEGSPKLRDEQDDKTFVYAYRSRLAQPL